MKGLGAKILFWFVKHVSKSIFKLGYASKLNEIYSMNEFQFEEMNIWQQGMKLSVPLFEKAKTAEDKKFYSFIYEYVTILHLYEMHLLIQKEQRENLYSNLAALSKQLSNFRKGLLQKGGKN